jgi:hypothetical protein
MIGLIVSGLVSSLISAGNPAPALPTHAASYLYQSAFALDRKLRAPAAPYEPQPGDICFAVNNHIVSRIGHHLSGAHMPNHSMLVFAGPDGNTEIIEAGPHSKLTIGVFEAVDYLHSYECEGSRVWVRRRKTPLTPEQSGCLTEICLHLSEKRFASLRLTGQLTPLRVRAPLRTAWLGKIDYDKRSYFCSELVLNCLASAGVIDPDPLRPAATYPSDLFFGQSRNVFVDRGIRRLECEWEAPARWTACPNQTETPDK